MECCISPPTSAFSSPTIRPGSPSFVDCSIEKRSVQSRSFLRSPRARSPLHSCSWPGTCRFYATRRGPGELPRMSSYYVEFSTPLSRSTATFTSLKNTVESTKGSGRDGRMNIQLVERYILIAQKYFWQLVRKTVELDHLYLYKRNIYSNFAARIFSCFDGPFYKYYFNTASVISFHTIFQYSTSIYYKLCKYLNAASKYYGSVG